MSDPVVNPYCTMLVEGLERMLDSASATDPNEQKRAWQITKKHAANFDEAKAKQDAKNLAEIAALKEKNRQLEARIDALLRRNAFSEGRAEALEEQINNGENERSAKKAKTTTDIPSIKGEGAGF